MGGGQGSELGTGDEGGLTALDDATAAQSLLSLLTTFCVP